jgi:hypothetical protein
MLTNCTLTLHTLSYLQRALLAAFHTRLRPSDLANIAQCALLEWMLSVLQQQQQQQEVAPNVGAAPLLVAGHVLRAINQHAGTCISQVRFQIHHMCMMLQAGLHGISARVR